MEHRLQQPNGFRSVVLASTYCAEPYLVDWNDSSEASRRSLFSKRIPVPETQHVLCFGDGSFYGSSSI